MSRLDAARLAVVDAAFADGTSDTLRRDVTLLVDDGQVEGLWFDGDGPDPDSLDAVIIDGAGSTIVPGLVDSHAHLSLPGGANWIARGFDPTDELLDVGEDNGEPMVRAGIRWARDVGAPRRADAGGRERALSLVLRDRWAGHADRPYVRAAGTWLARTGSLPHGLAIEIDHGADLVAAVEQQLDDGADLVKLYLDGPDADTAPFSANEVSAAVLTAHARGAKVAAHSSVLAGARVGAEAGVDSIEHGFTLDADAAAALAAHRSRWCRRWPCCTRGRASRRPRRSPIHLAGGRGRNRGAARTGRGERAARGARGRRHRGRLGLRRRIIAREPAGLGGRGARGGRHRTARRARSGDMARRRPDRRPDRGTARSPAVPRTSAWCTAIRCPIRLRSGGSG